MLSNLQRDIAVLDEKEKAKIERRRKLEEERKKRILDPKVRQKGVDTEYLAKQIEEKKERERKEKEEQKRDAEILKQTDDYLIQLANKQKEEERGYLKDLSEYRVQNQKVDTRREFDLNDPKARQKEKPLRVRERGDCDDDQDGDNAEGLSVSGLLVFDGEDLHYTERQKMQHEQQVKWAQAQVAERAIRKNKEIEEQRKFEEQERAAAEYAMKLAAEESKTRKEMETSIRDDNAALARSVREKKERDKQEDELVTLQAMKANITSDFMTENPNRARESHLPNKKKYVVQEFKGMTPEEIENIRKEQAKQADDKKAARERQQAEEKAWAQQAMAQERAALILQRQQDREVAQQNRALVEEQKQQAVDFKQRYNHLYKEVYTNVPTEDYFAQFNTSSR